MIHYYHVILAEGRDLSSNAWRNRCEEIDQFPPKIIVTTGQEVNILLQACLIRQVLVCSDGAPSRLATKLGLVTTPPDSTCSRAYVEGGTHKFKADGVVFYNRELMPGVCYSCFFFF